MFNVDYDKDNHVLDKIWLLDWNEAGDISNVPGDVFTEYVCLQNKLGS